ncbi:MAG: hypothetical protein ACLTJG_02455 [[Clostridium] innocuum]
MFMEDLISIGSIGLIKAVNTFKRDKEYQAGDLCVTLY